MRFDKRSTRSLGILFDAAVPRRADGALNLCADCQRQVWFSGGYVEWLASRLSALAELVRMHRAFASKVRRLRIGQSCALITNDREDAVAQAKAVATELALGILIRRRGAEYLTVTRIPASGIETEGHDRAAGRGAEHESPTAAGGDAHNIAQDIGGPSQ